MPIIGTTTDYTGRKKDILILQKVDPLSSAVQPVSVAFTSQSRMTAGVEKLVQRYLITLFTESGSQADYPAFGSSFFANLKTGRNKLSSIDLTHIFNFANAVVVRAFKEYQATKENLPLDEQLATAKLVEATFNSNAVHFSIELKTLAGDNIEFVLPLPL